MVLAFMGMAMTASRSIALAASRALVTSRDTASEVRKHISNTKHVFCSEVRYAVNVMSLSDS